MNQPQNQAQPSPTAEPTTRVAKPVASDAGVVAKRQDELSPPSPRLLMQDERALFFSTEL